MKFASMSTTKMFYHTIWTLTRIRYMDMHSKRRLRNYSYYSCCNIFYFAYFIRFCQDNYWHHYGFLCKNSCHSLTSCALAIIYFCHHTTFTLHDIRAFTVGLIELEFLLITLTYLAFIEHTHTFFWFAKFLRPFHTERTWLFEAVQSRGPLWIKKMFHLQW